jgi:M6 family metalloprotease-like protein
MLLRTALALLLAALPVSVGGQPPPKTSVADPKPAEQKAETPADLPGYKAVKDAIKADPTKFKAALVSAPTRPTSPGYLGVELAAAGKPTVEDVVPDSPAAKAGLKAGDVFTKIGDDPVATAAAAKERLRGLLADEKVTLAVERGGKPVELTATPKATSKPIAPADAPGGPAKLGVTSGDARKQGGVPVDDLTPSGGAEKAGVRKRDVILQLDDTPVKDDDSIPEFLKTRRPGDVVTVRVDRDGKELELRVTLGSSQPTSGRGGSGIGAGWDDRLPPRAWAKPTYKLAVIGIEYPDQKHNPKIADADWTKSLFSVGEYTGKSATGQPVYGSMADYYKEISYGQFKVEGAFVGWVEVSKKRLEYQTGNGVSSREKTALLTETMDKFLEQKGKDALKEYDGVFFLFAGGRVNTTRGSLYWPHRASFRHKDKSWPYFIVQEGGDTMTNISVFCHEFGHMLGLPDLYARPEQPGMEGVGVWCAMSQQLPNGRPQHFSAWSKERLGWLKPTVIDPRVKQKLVLSPIEDDNTQCFKVPLKLDGSEYLLLENRKKTLFDAGLPAEGLLVWRVIPGNATQQVFLEESHGIEGPSGPRSATGAVPFPSPANDSFTPFTTPSSKAQTGGGFDVYLTTVRRLPDGRVTFHIGYQYQ